MREVGLNGEMEAGVGDLVSRLPGVLILGSAVNRDPELEESSSSATGVSPTVGRLGGEKVWFPKRLLGLWQPREDQEYIAMMVNFTCGIDWVVGCPDVVRYPGCVCMMFLNEISI